MGGSRLILERDLADLSGGAAFRIIAAAFVLLAVALGFGAAGLVSGVAGTAGVSGATDAGLPALRNTYGQMLYFAGILPLLAFLWLFAGAVLAKEKASGHLETLLATPLEPRTICFAKSMAILLPGLVVTALTLCAVLVAAGLASRGLPGAASIVFSPPLLVACLLANPLVFSGLGVLTVILALRSSPDAAILPSFALGFGLMIVVPGGAAIGIVDLYSWGFAAASLCVAAAVWALAICLGRGLTKERIVLSGREAL